MPFLVVAGLALAVAAVLIGRTNHSDPSGRPPTATG